jgi:hypothetical protein
VPQGSIYGGGTATALGPTPDRLGKAIRRDVREAEKEGFKEGKRYERDKIENRQGSSDLLDQRSQMVIPPRRTSDSTSPQQVSQRVPSAASVNGWMARNRINDAEAPQAPVAVSVADAQK